jgi:hypothetical protein
LSPRGFGSHEGERKLPQSWDEVTYSEMVRVLFFGGRGVAIQRTSALSQFGASGQGYPNHISVNDRRMYGVLKQVEQCVLHCSDKMVAVGETL